MRYLKFCDVFLTDFEIGDFTGFAWPGLCEIPNKNYTWYEVFETSPLSSSSRSGGPGAIRARENSSFSGTIFWFHFRDEKPLSWDLKTSTPAPARTPTERQPGGDYGANSRQLQRPAPPPSPAHTGPPSHPPEGALGRDPPQAGALTGSPEGAGERAERGRGDLRAWGTVCRRSGR